MTSVINPWFLLPSGELVSPDDPQYEGIRTAYESGAPFLAVAPFP